MKKQFAKGKKARRQKGKERCFPKRAIDSWRGAGANRPAAAAPRGAIATLHRSLRALSFGFLTPLEKEAPTVESLSASFSLSFGNSRLAAAPGKRGRNCPNRFNPNRIRRRSALLSRRSPRTRHALALGLKPAQPVIPDPALRPRKLGEGKPSPRNRPPLRRPWAKRAGGLAKAILFLNFLLARICFLGK